VKGINAMTSTLEHTGCDECGSPQLARNTWFTGKLLTERDLTDEQRYLLGKIGRHNSYLHGSGIVCGLDVAEHPNPACRTESVIVHPGLAIDCCGHEILLTHDEVVPLAALIEQAWAAGHGTDPLRVQHGGVPHDGRAPVVADQHAGAVARQLLDHAGHVGGDLLQAVVGHGGRLVRAAVAPHIDGAGGEAGLGDRADLVAPAVPALGEAMASPPS